MDKEAIYLHALNLLLEPTALRKTMRLGLDAATLWDALDARLLAFLGMQAERAATVLRKKETIDIEYETEKLRAKEIAILRPQRADYPPSLQHIPDKPAMLYIKTKQENVSALFAEKSIAVVGPRYHSTYGAELVDIFVPPLARSGVTVVSGLALGIDGASHRLTLEHGGTTIAVLGSGIDYIYPPHHRRLAVRIIEEGGAIISEYPPSAEPLPFHFPERNRIIAGLNKAVLLIEAAEHSGGLITAQLALDYDRDVFVIPGNITQWRSKGSNNLLKEGALGITSPGDIFTAMDWKETPPTPRALRLSLREQNILALFSEKPVSLDALAAHSKLPRGTVAHTLLQLELQGLIRNPHGCFYERAGVPPARSH